MMWIYKKKLTCLKRHWKTKKESCQSKPSDRVQIAHFARKPWPRLYSIYLDSFIETTW